MVTGSQQGTLGQGLRFLEWTVQSGRRASPPVNGHTAENRKRGPSGGRRGEAVFPGMVKAAVLLSQGGSRFLCQERRRGRGAGSGCARAGGGDCHPPSDHPCAGSKSRRGTPGSQMPCLQAARKGGLRRARAASQVLIFLTGTGLWSRPEPSPWELWKANHSASVGDHRPRPVFLMSSRPDWVACSLAAEMPLGDICERFQRFSACQMEGARALLVVPGAALTKGSGGAVGDQRWFLCMFRSQELLGS